MRAFALSRLAATVSVIVTSWPATREHLRDAVAHQARADHRDAGLRHAQPAV